MKYKSKTEVMQEIEHHIIGDEPFLSFSRPRMIINLSGGWAGTHNFFEGYSGHIKHLLPGDILRFQMCRVSQVKMTWYERLWSWARRG